jgi:hypothetical protein
MPGSDIDPTKETTMTKTKTLILATFAALSLGGATAMAQDGNGGGLDYWSQQNVIAAQRAAAAPARTTLPVPSGSSDIDVESGAAHSATFILNHHLYGAGGVSG